MDCAELADSSIVESTLVEVQRELLRRYSAGEFDAALELLDREAGRIDALWSKVAWWRACLHARRGDADAALEVLEAAVEAGAWWSEATFRNETDLAPVLDHPRMAEVIRVCEERRRADPGGHPGLFVAHPRSGPGGPLVCVLPGRAETFEVAVGHWVEPALRAGWSVAVAESSQRDAIDGPVWDDAERSLREVTAHLAALEAEGGSIVLAGYSQGGRRALQLGLSPTTQVRAILALCPTVLRPSDAAEILGGVGEPPFPTVWILTGEGDPAREGQRMVAEALRSEGVDVQVEVVPRGGHFYPPDFADRLHWTLARIGR